MIGTALAEPKIVSLRHFVSEHRRERSDTLLIAKGEAGGIDEGVTVPRDGARAAAERAHGASGRGCPRGSAQNGPQPQGDPLAIVLRLQGE
jgi:hypothetical protein